MSRKMLKRSTEDNNADETGEQVGKQSNENHEISTAQSHEEEEERSNSTNDSSRTATEVMARSLNALMEKKDFKRFGMSRGSLKVNHLAFADDMIIMRKAEVRTMQMITNTLKIYEDTSGQKISMEKSAIYMHHSIAGEEAVIAEQPTAPPETTRTTSTSSGGSNGCISSSIFRRNQQQQLQQPLHRCNSNLKETAATSVSNNQRRRLPRWPAVKRPFQTRDFGDLRGGFARSVSGFNIEGLHLRKVIMLWRERDVKKAIRSYYRAIPNFIIWKLWRRRNRMKDEGKKLSIQRVIHNITKNIFMMLQMRKPNMKCPCNWPDMIKELKSYSPKMKAIRVLWDFPPVGWLKYNIDGASRGNPSISSYAFCLRNESGDLLYVERATIENTTNSVAEAKTILEACKHSRQEQHNNIIIQTDSMLLYKILEGKWSCPWIITEMVTEIKTCLQDKQHTFQHILREGN
ncbi:uncharacterized protein LOC129885490 [Solanum dulcamara]|uniref:uncharacterized protein LOC129885490 n=1 Tax=Solanum dulcamara TaxID=45834 RepID=UPI002485EEC2|nr:uncharacterized protein LOC129885490 [Solanum dulcamara]